MQVIPYPFFKWQLLFPHFSIFPLISLDTTMSNTRTA